MEEHRKIYVDSRCRAWPVHPNGNSFQIDLVRPIKNIKRVEILQATIPVYRAATWQEENKSAAIRIVGAYRRDVEQVLPLQFASDTPAVIPLATANASAFVYTFYQESQDAGLWKSDADTSIPRVDRFDISLVTVDPTTRVVTPYPLPDDGFAVYQNWSCVIEVVSLLGQT